MAVESPSGSRKTVVPPHRSRVPPQVCQVQIPYRFQGNEISVLKKIFFEPSYQSNWNQVATLLKYGGEKKISKIFEYFVKRKEDRQCSRLLIDPISSERRVERDRDCIIKFDRFYVNASLNSNDFCKLTLFSILH